MRVWDGIGEVPPLEGSVVTIGMFAGMHRGHQAIIDETTAQAHALGLPAIAVTFTPHPMTIHQPDRGIVPLSTSAQRVASLAAAGVDAVLLIGYDLEFASNSPEQFVKTYLVDVLKARAIVIGEDSRFGAGNTGDTRTMRELGQKLGFTTTIVEDLCDARTGRRWSSTWVREALADGDVATAGHILGRSHSVRGEVVHGAKRGRELGYPTANLQLEEIGVIPRDGVYAGWLLEGGRRHPAAISVGTNPQFEGVHRTVEAHVLGRTDLDLYGQVVTVEFTRWIRPMRKFESVGALLDRIAEDVVEAADMLGVPRPAPARPSESEPLA
ncbi:MAG TPA: bifunctional riboflavin kinase/FAD synthetase [Actinomycetaceae bacterium]|nr:bifunctional riboflavin kinase/FAD synthetase [Actinomycetaceae bacterium]